MIAWLIKTEQKVASFMKKFRGVFLKNEKEISHMRIANGMVSQILDAIAEVIKPGVSTMFLEHLAQKMCHEMNVRPSFQGYCGYPFALCCAVNETIVHGFPSEEAILQEGDIISCDMGVCYNGFHGDHARTIAVGEISEEAKKLCRVTDEALHLGIAAARVGNDLYDISAAVQRHAENNGYHVIQRFVGHGIGTSLHEKPEVPNFVPHGSISLPLQVGMVLAIEPMLAIGTHEVKILSDKWTANTLDGSLAAHFEHSIVIQQSGPEILSLSSNYSGTC